MIHFKILKVAALRFIKGKKDDYAIMGQKFDFRSAQALAGLVCKKCNFVTDFVPRHLKWMSKIDLTITIAVVQKNQLIKF